MNEQFKRERFNNAMGIVRTFGMAEDKQAQARVRIILDKVYRACSSDEGLFRTLAQEELADYESNKHRLATQTEKNDKHIDEIQKTLDATK